MFSRLFSCHNSKAKSNVTINNDSKTDQNKPKNIQWTDTLLFVPPINTGQVIKVYDGDTFTLAGHLPYNGSPLYRFSVRLSGIDCAEIKGKTEEEKECAIRARKELERLILNKIVILKNVKNEKYGRILADIYVDDLYVNQHMIDKGLAVSYDGGSKRTKSWFEIYKSKNTDTDIDQDENINTI
jgi:endonuclease YncB( thermonuclease family)